jgi:hypothetical protein
MSLENSNSQVGLEEGSVILFNDQYRHSETVIFEI